MPGESARNGWLRLAGVTHRDGPVTNGREKNNPLHWWPPIDAFGKQTSVPLLLNTSFHLHGEASGHSPTDATRAIFSSGMDALALEK